MNSVHETSPAFFGPTAFEVKSASFTVTAPLNACSALHSNVRGKVAIVMRGGCTFFQKVKMAAQAGARAVVIVNNQRGTIQGMSCPARENCGNLYTPAVFLSQLAGNALLQFAGGAPFSRVSISCDLVAASLANGLFVEDDVNMEAVLPATSDDDSGAPNTTVIAGAGGGAFLALVGVAAIIFRLKSSKRRRKAEEAAMTVATEKSLAVWTAV